jgi:DNA polymerase-3 subunit epsilon
VRFFSSPAWSDVVYWALDLETSSLDPRTGDILSVGMVPVRSGIVRWGERYYSLVRPTAGRAPSPEAMKIHHILPAEALTAPELPEVFHEIVRRLEEGVLLLHFARLDMGFLKLAGSRIQPRWRPPAVIDTVRLLARLGHRRRQLDPYVDSLPTDLTRARAEMGLPGHLRHHALFDALATAELFLALRSRLGAKTLRQLR